MNCAAAYGHGTNDMNGYVGGGAVGTIGTANVVGYGHITTNLGPHRAQTNIVSCVDIDLLWYAYKAYIVIIGTSQTSIYMYNC